NITVITAGRSGKFQIGEHIPPPANNLLRTLDIYTDFLKEDHQPSYHHCSYWGDNKRGYNDTILSPYGHGWHLDRQRFNDFLCRMLHNKGIKVMEETQYKRSHARSSGGWEVEIDDNGFLPADLLID